MRETPNFDSSEFDVNEPWPEGKELNRQRLAVIAQWLRDLAGVPGVITSANRSAERNEEVGGSETSQHLKAEAIDVVYLLCPIRALADRVLESIRLGLAPAFGQIIFYADRGHVHVSLPTLGPRNGEVRMSQVINGARVYPPLSRAEALPVLSDKQKVAGVVAGGSVVGLALLAFLAVAPSIRA